MKWFTSFATKEPGEVKTISNGHDLSVPSYKQGMLIDGHMELNNKR